MPRLIELTDADACPPALRLEPGDLVLVRCSGGRLTAGDAVRLLGPFLPAAATAAGEVLVPAGGVAGVVLLADRPGAATFDLVFGGPFGPSRTVPLAVAVG